METCILIQLKRFVLVCVLSSFLLSQCGAVTEQGTFSFPFRKPLVPNAGFNEQLNPTDTLSGKSTGTESGAKQVFTETTFRYCLKYPLDWELLTLPLKKTLKSISKDIVIYSPQEGPFDHVHELMHIGAYNMDNSKQTPGETFDQIYAGYSNGTQTIVKKTPLKMCNYPAIKVTLATHTRERHEKDILEELVVLTAPGKTIVFIMETESGKESKYAAIFQDILDSFELY